MSQPIAIMFFPLFKKGVYMDREEFIRKNALINKDLDKLTAIKSQILSAQIQMHSICNNYMLLISNMQSSLMMLKSYQDNEEWDDEGSE